MGGELPSEYKNHFQDTIVSLQDLTPSHVPDGLWRLFMRDEHALRCNARKRNREGRNTYRAFVRRHFNRGDGRLQQDPSRAKIVSPLKNLALGPEDEKTLRRSPVKKALAALQAELKG
jgi:hypothetical protein